MQLDGVSTNPPSKGNNYYTLLDMREFSLQSVAHFYIELLGFNTRKL